MRRLARILSLGESLVSSDTGPRRLMAATFVHPFATQSDRSVDRHRIPSPNQLLQRQRTDPSQRRRPRTPNDSSDDLRPASHFQSSPISARTLHHHIRAINLPEEAASLWSDHARLFTPSHAALLLKKCAEMLSNRESIASKPLLQPLFDEILPSFLDNPMTNVEEAWSNVWQLGVASHAATRVQWKQWESLRAPIENRLVEAMRLIAANPSDFEKEGQVWDMARLLLHYTFLKKAPPKPLVASITTVLHARLDALSPRTAGAVVTLLHALVLTGNQDKFIDCYRAVEPFLTKQVEMLTNRNISDLVWDLATTETRPTSSSLLPALINHLSHDRTLPPPANTSYTLWSLAKLSTPSLLFHEALDALRPSLASHLAAHRLSASQLPALLWALGEYNADPGNDLTRLLLEAIKPLAPQFTPVSVASALQLFAKLGKWDEWERIALLLHPSLVARGGGLRMGDVSRIMWSMGAAAGGKDLDVEEDKRGGGSSSSSSSNKVDRVALLYLPPLIKALRTLTPRDGSMAAAANIFWALAKMNRPNDLQTILPLFAPLVSTPTKWGAETTSQSIASIAYAFSTCAVEPSASIVAALSEGALRFSAKATEQEVAILLTFYSDFGFEAPRDVLAALGARLESLGEHVSPQAASLSIHALTSLVCGPYRDKVEETESSLAMMERLAMGLGRVSSSTLALIQLRQLFQCREMLLAIGAKDVLSPHLPAALLSKGGEAWRRQLKASSPVESRFQQAVAAVLTSQLGVKSDQVVMEHPTEDGARLIDVALIKHRVAIECDGPDHFTRNEASEEDASSSSSSTSLYVPPQRRQLARKTLPTNVLLEARGWKVVRVPFDAFQAAGGEGQGEWLRAKLKEHGVEL